MELADIVSILETKHGVKLGETLGLGHMVKTVYRATRSAEPLVVKIGLAPQAAEEVRKNRVGYQRMHEIGATRLLPSPLEFLEIDGVSIIVMGDCGKDFWHAVKESADPASLYRHLLTGMDAVYRETLDAGRSPVAPLEHIRDLLVEQCDGHIGSFIDEALRRGIRIASFTHLAGAPSSFSSFDFTPEDVFVNGSVVKYADPLENVHGIPAVDLACFAGVSRDAYALPGAEYGYRLIEQYVREKLPPLFGLPVNEVMRLFHLGRALQCALGARFRLASEPDCARRLAADAESFIRLFLQG